MENQATPKPLNNEFTNQQNLGQRLVLFTKEENINFFKNLLLILVFFILTPVTLGVSLFSLSSLKTADAKKLVEERSYANYPQSGVRVYASLPLELPTISATIGESDARPEIVKKYLTFYDSPLVPLSSFIVQTADKYGLDYRLTTAIAQQESNLCKIIPPESHNCWGWGITSVGSLGFKSYETGIETVSKGLRDNYLNKGYNSIEEIMSKYTPQSNGSWAAGVSEFMTEME